jgi:hypothetical protein
MNVGGGVALITHGSVYESSVKLTLSVLSFNKTGFFC